MKNRAVVGSLATALVVALVVAGLFAVGSPATARKLRADEERSNRITQLHFVLASQVRSEGTLPETLAEVDEEAIRRAGYGFDARKDPESDETFEYRKLSDRTYEVCATFHLSSDDRRTEDFGGYPEEISHRAGRNCFERTVTNQDVESAPDFREGPFPVREAPVKASPSLPPARATSRRRHPVQPCETGPMSMTPYLAEGIRLFQDGQYFLSHETLEEHWAEAPEEDRNFYQGLIHLAVGFLHHGKGNAKGAKLQFAKASKRLAEYPDTYQDVDLTEIRQFLDRAPEALEGGGTLTPPKLLGPVR